MTAVLARYGPPAALVLLALFVWQGSAYVGFGEGVYLYSARLIADGAVPYEDFIAAHPPLLFYGGAAVVAVWDSLTGVRAVLSLVPLVRARWWLRSCGG